MIARPRHARAGRQDSAGRILETQVAETSAELARANARLAQKVRELKVLYDLAIATSLRLDIRATMTMALEQYRDVLGFSRGGFFLHEEKADLLQPCPPAFDLPEEALAEFAVPAVVGERSALGQVFRDGVALLANDLDDPAADRVLKRLADRIGAQALWLVPVRTADRAVGVFVADAGARGFTEDDLKLLSILNTRVATSVEHTRLYEEAQARARDLGALQRISSAITTDPHLESVLTLVTGITTEAMGADIGAVLRHDPGTGELVLQSGAVGMVDASPSSAGLRIRVQDPHSQSAQAFREARPVFDDDVPPGRRGEFARITGVRSLMTFPLLAEGRPVGVLRIGSRRPRAFSEPQRRLAGMIANQAAVIIENAALWEALRRANVELDRLNRVKVEFVSIVSHELRTPLTAVKGFVDVILNGEAGQVTDQQRRFLSIVNESVDRLTLLITDLLDIAKIESGQIRMEPAPSPVDEAVRRVAARFRPLVRERGLRLEVELADPLPQALVDGERLDQVLDNLVSNAVKFTPEGGTITVWAGERDGEILIRVSDTGIGIAPEHHARIFEKFFQVDSSSTRGRSGTGLGLSIVKTIVEQHGGRIWVESDPASGRRGTTFALTLPLAEAMAGGSDARAPLRGGVEGGRPPGKERMVGDR